MFIDFMLKVFEEHKENPAIVWQDQVNSYAYLLDRVHSWQAMLQTESVPRAAIAIIEADFSPKALAIL